MNMVERVARAIWISQHPDKEVDPWFRHCIPDARAAIAAMREPTEAMLNAGIAAANVASVGLPEFGPQDEAEMVFNAMIDAALKEQP